MTQPSLSKETLLNWLDTQKDNMVILLRDLVNIDSNSFDKAGVDRVAARLGEFFDEQSIPYETIPIATHGDGMRAIVAGGNGDAVEIAAGQFGRQRRRRGAIVGEIFRPISFQRRRQVHQLTLRFRASTVADLLGVGRVGDRGENRHDHHHDHQLNQREARQGPSSNHL